MRLRIVMLSLVVAVALCVAAACVLGPVEAVALGCIVFSLVCGRSLYLATRSAQKAQEAEGGTPVQPEVPAAEAPAPKGATPQEDAPSPPEASTAEEAAQPPEPPAAEAVEDRNAPLLPANGAQDQTAHATVQAVPQASAEEVRTFDYERFERTLLFSSDALSTVRTMVRRIRTRKRHGKPISGAEAFLDRQIGDVVMVKESDAPRVTVARPFRSGLFYLRLSQNQVSYGTYLGVLKVEAALNAVRFAHEYYGDLSTTSEEDLCRSWQRTTTSVCGQAPEVDTADWSYLAMPWQSAYGPEEQGEWAVRHALAEAIESVQVPYRLEADFRCNVAAGDVAIEFGVTPARIFPHDAFVSGLGIVPTTGDMRRREASAYAARLGILLASHAFRASSRIRRVWVAAIEKTPKRRICHYSVCIGRKAFSHLRLTSLGNPLAVLRSLGASLDEADGTLLPTKSIFYLEDELFCPPKRHDLWKLSERSLPASAVQALGTSRVSGLMIHEELPRTLAADEMMRGLAASDDAEATSKSVRSILDVAHKSSDLSVWSAAERVAEKLVDGRLELDDPEALHDELVAGDELTKAVEKAQSLLMRREPSQALRLLQKALRPLEESGSFGDTGAVVYRSFDSFSERVLYNRLNAHDKRSVILVPDAYLMAHLIAAALLVSLPAEEGGSVEAALLHARRAIEVAPVNGPANLGLAACLEAVGDTQGAIEQLKGFLEVAHHPQGMALAYFRLASLEMAQGMRETAQACYQRSVALSPALLPFVFVEYQHLLQAEEEEGEEGAETATSIELMDEARVEKLLHEEEIPLAPTPRTSFILYDGAAASIDAEVFPVAHDLMRIIEAFTGDDVIHGIRSSLEHEPDA